jgi:hypothetical protein
MRGALHERDGGKKVGVDVHCRANRVICARAR